MFQNDYDRYWLKLWKVQRLFRIANSNIMLFKKIHVHNQKCQTQNCLNVPRLSNHNLRIETGRRLRPKLPRQARKCFICIDEIENELHFVVKCPLYSSERKELYKVLMHNSKHFDSLTSDEQKLMFIMTNEDVMAKLAKFVFNSMQRVIKMYINVSKPTFSLTL